MSGHGTGPSDAPPTPTPTHIGGRTAPANEIVQSTTRPRISQRAFVAFLVWCGEAFVGLIPLLAHYGIAAAATRTEFEALCTSDVKNCHLTSDTPFAEICIVAVVTAGVSAVASLGYGHHMRTTPPNGITFLLLLLSLAACIVGVGMYVVSTIGILNSSVGWATWATLIAALVASLFLSLERAVR